LVRAEFAIMGAEVCHGAAFISMFPVAMYFLAVGRMAEVFWIIAFSLVLHGYPVMLQRANRWRIQQVSAHRRVRPSE
jgi:hypothetical protein